MDLHILYEDIHILAVIKPAGVASEGDGMPRLIGEYLSKNGAGDAPYVGVIHRLDRDVSGVMVFAKSEKAAAALSGMIARREFEKEYLAVVSGETDAAGEMQDLLYHDKGRNKTFVVKRPRRGVRDASLEYRTLATKAGNSLVHVRLHTGRTHQIRVQFASRKHPLLGDGKYGGGKGKIALFSHKIAFIHPISGKEMCFTALPPLTDAWAEFGADMHIYK